MGGWHSWIGDRFGGTVTNATVAALKWTVQRSVVQITIPNLILNVSDESDVNKSVHVRGCGQ